MYRYGLDPKKFKNARSAVENQDAAMVLSLLIFVICILVSLIVLS